MGYDLSSRDRKTHEDGYFRFNIAGWSAVFNIALEYGWEPKGTVLEELEAIDLGTGETVTRPADLKWDGGYGSNDGQTVSAEDAESMRESLLKALADPECWEGESTGWKEKIERFTKFLENGSFRIF